MPSSITIESDVHHFCRALLCGIKINYMLDYWLARLVTWVTGNAETKELNIIIGTDTPDELKAFTSTETVGNEN